MGQIFTPRASSLVAPTLDQYRLCSCLVTMNPSSLPSRLSDRIVKCTSHLAAPETLVPPEQKTRTASSHNYLNEFLQAGLSCFSCRSGMVGLSKGQGRLDINGQTMCHKSWKIVA